MSLGISTEHADKWGQAIQIGLVLLTIEGALWTQGPTQIRWFVVAFVTLALCVIWGRPGTRELGIGLQGMTGASISIPVAFIACSTLLAVAWWAGTLKALYGHQPPAWHALGYSIWALEQEFILNSFFFNRFEKLLGDGTYAMFLTAGLFAFVHVPNPVLVPATFVGGLFFIAVFRRFRNIYPLAIAHAMFGITLALTVPDHWIRHMRVGLGFLRFHMRA